MLKALAPAALLGVGLAASGCATYVKTYDSGGNLIGTCQTGISLFNLPFLPAGRGHCQEPANLRNQR